ncbi:MAG: flagellar basal body L-ring protein FlgH [Candidatus Brocadiia bacterium]
MSRSARTTVLVCTTALLGLWLVGTAGAESLWEHRQRDTAMLYSDNAAAEVGDTLTVLIADQSSFSLEGEREMEKTTAHSASANFDTAVVDVTLPAGRLSQDTSRTMEGSDEYTGTRTFSDSVTVTVKDKLPNGNLVIAGRKQRYIAGEEVVTVLNGIVRPEDVGGSNTVSSRLVAHLSLYYETTGSSDAFIKEGWANRILSYLWPF